MSDLEFEREHNLHLSKLAFEAVESILPAKDRKEIFEYIYLHNEWGLGIETMISVFQEENIQLTVEQIDAIKNASTAMKIPFQIYKH